MKLRQSLKEVLVLIKRKIARKQSKLINFSISSKDNHITISSGFSQRHWEVRTQIVVGP